jgi:hypothetical protein
MNLESADNADEHRLFQINSEKIGLVSVSWGFDCNVLIDLRKSAPICG